MAETMQDTAAANAGAAAATTMNGNASEGPAVPVMMSSFFPSPPSYISHFTPSNVALAHRLVALPSFSYEEYRRDYSPATWKDRQATLLEELDTSQDVTDSVRDLDLVTLVKPPDVSLIEEDGHWMSFGQAWPVGIAGIEAE